MFQLKTLSRDGIGAALEKAERYRLINEPGDAESICLDILEVDPDNQQALVALLLARTDQFRALTSPGVEAAREVLPRLAGEFAQAYYAGIICERWGKAQYHRGVPGAGALAYQWLRQAMEWYERAAAVRPPGNDNALLRWNACARFLMRHERVRPEIEEPSQPMLE